MFKTFCILPVLLLLCACRKENAFKLAAVTPPPSLSFKQYTIPRGDHYCTENLLKPLEISELAFAVRFDSSAIYQTIDPENQYDINKLYGFADNGGHHQQFSARFGWRWSDGALQLFAYTYNNGIRDSKELGTVAIGKEIHCAIKASGEVYVFMLDHKMTTMPRLSTTEKANGYQLYPYFGGDEIAPHEVNVWIKEE